MSTQSRVYLRYLRRYTWINGLIQNSTTAICAIEAMAEDRMGSAMCFDVGG